MRYRFSLQILPWYSKVPLHSFPNCIFIFSIQWQLNKILPWILNISFSTWASYYYLQIFLGNSTMPCRLIPRHRRPSSNMNANRKYILNAFNHQYSQKSSQGLASYRWLQIPLWNITISLCIGHWCQRTRFSCSMVVVWRGKLNVLNFHNWLNKSSEEQISKTFTVLQIMKGIPNLDRRLSSRLSFLVSGSRGIGRGAAGHPPICRHYANNFFIF